MVEFAYERTQLVFGQNIEEQDLADGVLDVVNDRLFDEGSDPMEPRAT